MDYQLPFQAIVLVPQFLPIAIQARLQLVSRAPGFSSRSMTNLILQHRPLLDPNRCRFLCISTLLIASSAMSQNEPSPASGTAAVELGEQQVNGVLRTIPEVLVGLGGFEPPTSPLSGVRSNQLSYRPKQRKALSVW